MRSQLTPLRLWLLVLPAVLATAATASEVSILGTYSSGDFGGAVDNTVQSTWLRFATGDRYQFRVAAPYLRIEVTDVVIQPGMGSIPTRREGRQGQTNGTGGQNGQQMDNSTEDDFSDQESTTATSSTASGLGDVWMSGFMRLLGGNAKVYRMDTGLEVKAPVADETQLLGTGEWDYRFVLSGEYRFWTALTFATVGWNQLGDPEWVDLNNVLDLVVGAESDPLWDRFIVTGWFEGNQETITGLGNRTAVGVGFRSLGRFRWRVLATAGLSGPAEDFSIGFGLSMGIEPPKTGVGGVGL